MSVSALPAQEDEMALWSRYEALVKAVIEDESLRLNLDHQREIMRAHRRWSDRFLAGDK